ncbi:hypothetical protein N9U65_01665 [Planctomycetaceae bacterium]|nr:hypothetical protein [Planctomycetaceae bacterium]
MADQSTFFLTRFCLRLARPANGSSQLRSFIDQFSYVIFTWATQCRLLAVWKNALLLHPNFNNKTALVLVGSGREVSFPVVMRRIVYNSEMRTHALLCTILVFACIIAGSEALGCPTCKDGLQVVDGEGANIARGYFYSILLMIAMPFTLAGSFGLYVWREMRRQQRAASEDAANTGITVAGLSYDAEGSPKTSHEEYVQSVST